MSKDSKQTNESEKSFIQRTSPEAVGGIIAAIIAPALIFIAGVMLRYVTPAIYLATIVLVVVAVFFMEKQATKAFGVLALFSAIAIVSTGVLIIRTPPWCGVEPIRISIEQEQSGRIIQLENKQATVSRHTVFLIQASTISSGIPRLGLTCDWDNVGDGEILQRRGCKLVFLTGEDDGDDLIRVSTNVLDCPHLEHNAFFMSPVDGE